MLWLFCHSCRASLHTADKHGEWVSCLGAASAETALTGTECHHCGDVSNSPRRSFLEAPLYSSRAPLEVGSTQLAVAESRACAGQTEPGSRHAISEQCPLRRVDAPPTNGSGNMGNLRQARGRPLRLRRQHSLPNFFSKGQGRVDPRLAQPPPSCLSPDCPDPAGNQANPGTEAQSSVSGPALEEQALVRGAVSAAHCSPVAHSPETRPRLSGERNDLAPPARTLGVTSLASWWEPSDLPESVLNTIYQARAPSTRHLYALNPCALFKFTTLSLCSGWKQPLN